MNSLSITWFEQTASSRDTCLPRILNIWKIMVGPDANLTQAAEEDFVKPGVEFQQKFYPNMILEEVGLDWLGPCAMDELDTVDEVPEEFLIPPPPPRITQPFGLNYKDKNIVTQLQPTINPTYRITEYNKKRPKGPLVVDRNAFVVSTKLGQVQIRPLPIKAFQNKQDVALRFELAQWGNGLPPWVSIDSARKYLVALPTEDDLPWMDPINSTHSVWTGGLVAIGGNGGISNRKMVKIEVDVSSLSKTSPENKPNHQFRLVIDNYSLKVGLHFEDESIITISHVHHSVVHTITIIATFTFYITSE